MAGRKDVLIVRVLLPKIIDLSLRSKTQGRIEVLQMREHSVLEGMATCAEAFIRDFALWSQGFPDCVGIRKALKLPAGCSTVESEIAGETQRLHSLATPTMQAMQETWKGPGARHASGCGFCFDWSQVTGRMW